MSKDAIMRLESTVLYEQLVLKEENDHQLSELVKKIVSNVAPILATVGNNMPEFTLHDANHSAKVVEIMSRIMPEDVLQQLNTIELTLLILSGYIHDIGMTCSSKEREDIIKNNPEYAALVIEDIDKKNLLSLYKAEGNHRAATFIENQLFTEYLRRNHVKRSREYVLNNLSKGDLLLSWNETPLYKYLISVCDSHELPVESLNDLKRWSRKELVRNVRVNIQYLSLILRLADILDLDPERTPKCVYEFVDPEDPKSIVEWKKHRSMIGWDITPERIEFSAECTDPNSERALRRFLEWIEVERRDSLAIALKYNDEISKKYRLNLNEPVSIEGVRSNGTYIYSDFRFELDYRRVLDLLMGQRLYKNPCVALRELLQNAFDAIEYRKAMGEYGYLPKVTVTLSEGYLTVEDNGMGMDENIFKKYFINVGKSYYSSPECAYKKEKLDITSEFGIGILSVFMVSESIEVESRRNPENPLQPPQPILVEIPKAHEYFIQRRSHRTSIGTRIKMKLKENNPFDNDNLVRIIKELVPFSKYQIEIDTSDYKYIYDLNSEEEAVDNSIERIVYRIPLDENSEYENDIKGFIYIVSGRDFGIFIDDSGSSVVAQRGFKIGLPNISLDDYMEGRSKMDNLLPQWINTLPYINLTKECALTLTPDRSDVVVDNQFRKIKRKIEDKIIEFTSKYLTTIKDKKTSFEYLEYFNDLLEASVIKGEGYIGFEISEEGSHFILNFMPLLILGKNGDEDVIFGESISDAKIIVVISEDSICYVKDRKEFRKSINRCLGSEAIVIITQKVGHYSRGNLLRYIYGKFNGEFISEIEGVTCSLIDNRKNDTYIVHIDGRMQFTDNIIGEKSTDSILITNSSYFSSRLSIVYNMRHPVFTPFNIKGKKVDREYEKLLLELDNSITSALEKSIKLISKTTTDIDWLRKKENEENYNFYVINIFDKMPNLIEELNNIVLEFWKKGIEVGAIGENLEIPKIGRDNFPWFW